MDATAELEGCVALEDEEVVVLNYQRGVARHFVLKMVNTLRQWVH